MYVGDEQMAHQAPHETVGLKNRVMVALFTEGGNLGEE